MKERLFVYLNYLEQDAEISSKIWFHLDVLLKQILLPEIIPLHLQTWSEEDLEKDKLCFLLNFTSVSASKDVNFLSKIHAFINFYNNADVHLRSENLLFNFLIDQQTLSISDFSDFKNYHITNQMTLGSSTDQDLNQLDWIHLTDCAYAIKKNYNHFKSGRPDSTRGTIYLATVDEDLIQSKKTLRLELESMGFEVLSNEDHSNAEITNSKYDVDKIQRCDLSIHLVGTGYGNIKTGNNISYIEFELNQALQIHKEDFRVFIWSPPDLNIQDVRQKSFFESLKREADQLDQVEMVISSIEYFKILLSDILLSPQPKEEGSDLISSSEKHRFVYLIYEKIDQSHVSTLRNQLRKAGYKVIEPAFDKMNNQRIQHHYQTINKCESAIIFVGNVSRNWVKMKMMDLVKAPGFGSDSQLKKKFVVCTGSFDELQFDVHHNFSIEENFDPQKVDLLVERLQVK